MKLDLRERKDVTILDVEGQITAGGGDQILQEAVDTLVAAGRTRIILNLARVDFMDSAGMGELVASHRMVERFGGKLKIMRPHSRVENTLTTAQLLPLFEVFDDEEEAVDSFGED